MKKNAKFECGWAIDMQVFRSLDEYTRQSGKRRLAMALGNFDGLHRGHCAVLRHIFDDAALVPAVFTFREPPLAALCGYAPKLLLSLAQKEAILAEMGVQVLIEAEFAEVRDMSSDAFLAFLQESLGVEKITVGYDCRFGAGGAGDAQTLRDFGETHGLSCVVEPPVRHGGEVISSTRIRACIEFGAVDEAAIMLSRPYAFCGAVLHGQRRGRMLDFPTLNQAWDTAFVCPRYGVYASTAVIAGEQYRAVTNIGVRPTYPLDVPLAETHVIGFSGDAYGQEVCITLERYLREERQFPDAQALREQLRQDVESR